MKSFILVLALSSSLLISNVQSHGFLTSPFQRGYVQEGDNNAGQLANNVCGSPQGTALDPKLEVKPGDTLTVEWQQNHAPTNDHNIIIQFGDPTDGSDPNNWPVIEEGEFYPDASKDIQIPGSASPGTKTIRWSWNFGGSLYKSCGDVNVAALPPGEVVKDDKACSENGCQNGGQCIAGSEPGSFSCKCNGDFGGDDCSIAGAKSASYATFGAAALVASVGAGLVLYKRRTGSLPFSSKSSRSSYNASYDQFSSYNSGGGGASGSRRSKGSKGSKGNKSRRSKGSKGSKSGNTLAGGRMSQTTGMTREQGSGSATDPYASNRSRNSKSSKGSKTSKTSKRSKSSKGSRGKGNSARKAKK